MAPEIQESFLSPEKSLILLVTKEISSFFLLVGPSSL